MTRVFLHVDMDAFFAAVEQLDHPEWRGRPVIVGAAPNKRGVVAAASYEARKFGVHSAMPSREAGRRCPDGVFTPPRGERYAAVSRRIMAIFEHFTPLIEPLSIDEAFLDVTGAQGLFGTGPDIARAVKQAVRNETGLTASVGVAPNKFLAKLASEQDKPDGLTVAPINTEEIRAFLAPLPVTRIWGVGPKNAAILAKHGIRKVADLQQAAPEKLARWFGSATAAHYHALAFGRDTREICLDTAPKSLSREHTFSRDCTNRERIRSVLLDLAEDVGRRLRRQRKYARLAVLKLRWRGFETKTRQRPFPRAVHDDFALRETADEMLRAENLNRPVRLVGFGVSRLCDGADIQLDFFASETNACRRERLSRAVDELRQRLGPESIVRAARDRLF